MGNVVSFLNSSSLSQTQTNLTNEGNNYIPNTQRTPEYPKRPFPIHALPTSLFRVIRTFLSSPEYSNLMNSNVATFRSIKHETIYYDIIHPERWFFSISETTGQIESCPDAHIFLTRLIQQNVKDKSKQISVTVRHARNDFIRSCYHLFEGIHKLSLDSLCYFDWEGFTSPADLFNNITQLTLKTPTRSLSALLPEFQTLTSITCGLENVKRLQLSGLVDLKELMVNQNNTMEEIKIFTCPLLTELAFPLESLERIELIGLKDSFQRLKGNAIRLKHLVLDGTRINHSLLEDVHRFIPTLQSLTLIFKEFPADYQGFNLMNRVPELSLLRFAEVPIIEEFPIFYGKKLNIMKFDISLWALAPQDAFRNLVSLRLERCKGLRNLPTMSELVDLQLDSGDLETIPSLPKLKRLKLAALRKLVAIDPIQPSLQDVNFHNLLKLADLSFAAHSPIRSMTLTDCSSVSDISMLGKIEKLSIMGKSKITSFNGLAGVPGVRDRRSIELDILSKVTDFSALHHIHSLSLRMIDNLTSCEGIHDFDHLSLNTLHKAFTTTRGLRNIRCSLIIHNCALLRSLVDIEGIPSVTIGSCKNIESYSNLKNHSSLTIYGLSKEAEEELKSLQRPNNIQSITICRPGGVKEVYQLCEPFFQTFKVDIKRLNHSLFLKLIQRNRSNDN